MHELFNQEYLHKRHFVAEEEHCRQLKSQKSQRDVEIFPNIPSGQTFMHILVLLFPKYPIGQTILHVRSESYMNKLSAQTETHSNVLLLP